MHTERLKQQLKKKLDTIKSHVQDRYKKVFIMDCESSSGGLFQIFVKG